MKLLPLDAPGLKPPGPTFVMFAEKITGVSLKEKINEAMAEAGRTRKYTAAEQTVLATRVYRKTIRNLLKRCLKSSGDFEMPMPVGREKFRPMPVVTGRVWGSDVVGPQRARVMVIDKIVNEQQRNTGLAFASDQGDILQEACDMAGINDYEEWYVTNVIKTEHPQASKTSNLSSQMLQDWLPALQQEIRIVQPDFILCLGADAVRALFGKNQTLKSIEGRVVEYEYSTGIADAEGNVPHKKAMVTATISPNYVLHEPEVIDQLELGVSRFGQLVSGGRWDQTEDDIEHYVIDSIDELKALRRRIRRECVDNIVAIDAEWHGDHPENKGSYLRTFQISWAHKKACCVSLRHPGGEKRFQGSLKHCAKLINSILRGRVIVGHFLVADAEWLEPFGVKLREFMRVPNNWLQYQECVKDRRPCGFDTGYAWHSLAETAEFGLKDMSLRFTEAPRYDVALQECVKKYCSDNKLKAEQLEGYGFIPDDILEPYACLHHDSLVQLADGSWQKIGHLVRDRYAGKVKGMINGRVADVDVTNWHRRQVNQKEWRQLVTANSQYGRHGLLGPVLTPDHKVVTQRGKVRCDELRIGEDGIVTDNPALSADQISVLLGSGLGDGGFVVRNNSGVGFGFSQRRAKVAYADWKASVLSNLRPSVRRDDEICKRYELAFSPALGNLLREFPRHDSETHGNRKLRLSEALLDRLGPLGLAVWYQDDGTFVPPETPGAKGSVRIYCRAPKEEIDLTLSWLQFRFGEHVTYNENNKFFQFGKESLDTFLRYIQPYMHPSMQYKTPLPVRLSPRTTQSTELFVDTILEVREKTYDNPNRRGNGVRYCLTTDAGNFLTKVGFVSNCYDADVTRRIAIKLIDMLDADQFGNSCWEPFWINMRMWPVILEINSSGLPLDKKRVDSLTDLYMANRDWLLRRLRKIAKWPDFNINSVNQVKEFLFGERYNGVVNKENPKARVKLRPEGARTLGLTPVLTTDKRPMVWTDVVEKGLEDEKSPSTKSSALVLMAEEINAADPSVFAKIKTKDRKTGEVVTESFSRADVVNLVRDYKFISQILKNVLRPPLLDQETEQYLLDEDENYVYEKGFAAACCDDGRVRTHVYPTKETGRWATSRPPTQNFAKRREEEYKRILQDDYQAPLRSVVKADEGTVLIEADYIGAELFAMAMLSGDETMLEHTRRNTLPEEHPDYYDIHSNIAVMAFNLDCAPTKSALKAIKKSQLRIVAKCVPGHVRLQTDQGWVRMKTLCGQVPEKEGLDVSESGIQLGSLTGQTPLLSLYNAGVKKCVRIETERGYRLDAANGHHIVVMGDNGKLEFKKAKDIQVGDYVALRMGDDTFGTCTDFPQIDWTPKTNFRDLPLPKKFNTDWAAFLGLYLAEGGLDGPTGSQMQISLACEDDPEFAEATEQLLRRIFGNRLGVSDIEYAEYQNQKKFSVSNVKLAAWLRENATTSCETHRIPEFVFKWPKQLQASFLRWLFEGDGSVKRNGAGVTIGYSTASEELARDVQLLLTNFGIETSLASETRENYDGVYWVLALFSNDARARFAEQIGFVTTADREIYEAGASGPSFNCDRRIIPNQVEYLRALMPAVKSPVKEKCRECVRTNSRVQPSPSRLRLILEHVDSSKLAAEGLTAYQHLLNLVELPLVFQQVRAVSDLGRLPCYDVETTPTHMHVVNFDGFATHQSVVFGVAYGRQAKAIALAAREEKIFITVEQAQATIDALFRLYPKLKPFFADCQRRAIEERWLMNSYGRSRRFGVARQSKTIGDYQRQAMNFPVQGLIADAVSRAMNNLAIYREEHPEVDFRFKLQVHDAIMLQAPYSQVARICDDVLPLCMVTNNPIYPCRLDGYPMGNKPYYLGIDTSIAHHWGELMYPDECKAVGIKPKYAGWLRHRDLPGYVHVEEKKGFIWQKGTWNQLSS